MNEYYDDDDLFSYEKVEQPKVWASQDIDAPLMVVNYSDRRFTPGNSQVIFGREERDLNWVYSDHVWEWDRTKAEQANEVAKKSGANPRSPRYYQEFLRAFYSKPNLELVCVQGGYNAATLYAFYVYGYRVN